jgi:rhodanese-related sulfurtransferase
VALRNGTIGWTLAGQALERGRDERFPEVAAAREDEARAAARDVAYRAGVRRLDRRGLDILAREPHRTLYRFDVRTPEEYAAGHLVGFRSAPGGQLVQETDVFAPVRGARIVLADDRGVRADMSASWLAQMGWEVYVLDGFEGARESGPWAPTRPPLPKVQHISPADLAAQLERGAVVLIDLAPSPTHRRGHIPRAWFVVRSRLAEALGTLPGGFPYVLTSPDGALASFAAAEFEELTEQTPLVLEGGTDAWSAAGLSLETGLQLPASGDDDVYRRPYEGADNPKDAMQAYLDWEFGLVEQLRRDGAHGFYVI